MNSAAEPMHVFVGTDDSQYVATRVLEHSIRKHASGPVVFHPMSADGIPAPKEKKNRPRTAFSFCRFTIPERMGFRGRGLYLDADMLVLADLAELWRIPFGAQKVLCTSQPEPPPAWRENKFFHSGRQFSVMLLDCERLPWRIDEIVRGLDEERYTYSQLMFELCLVQPDEIADRIPVEWNHLERLEPGRTRLVHYTVVPTQPWKHRSNPNGAIWDRHLAEAVAAGAVTPRDLEIGVAQGHLHPDLLEFRAHAPSAGAGALAQEPRSEAQQEPAPEIELLFFVQLVTDVDLLLPLVAEARRRTQPRIRARVAVDARLLETFPRLRATFGAAGVPIETVTLEQLIGRKAPDLSRVDAVISATESSANPHEAARRLARHAHRLGKVSITLQHGFENIGLTWFDHVHTPTNTRFVSDRILVWGPTSLLHPDALRETRAKCIPVGCTKEVGEAGRPRGLLRRPSERPHFVAVFENLHWHRFDFDYRRRFLGDLETAARACPETTFFIRPHPAGKWMTTRYKGPLPSAPNLVIADPGDARWDGWVGNELLAISDGVVTTPSTVALDAARSGIATAVVGYDLDVARYAPLPVFRSTRDWIDFATRVRTPSGRAELAAIAKTFKERVTVPGDGIARALDVVLAEIAASRPVRTARRARVAVARLGDVLTAPFHRAPARVPATAAAAATAPEPAPSFDPASETLVVVSHWNGRPADDLHDLLDDLARHPAGAPFKVRVVVNCDHDLPLGLAAPPPGVEVIERDNVGYNLGAWEHGWRSAPAFASYLFLQDDCRVQRDEWLRPFREKLADPAIGLVGERLNPAWNCTWAEIEARYRGHVLREHFIDGLPAERMAAYHDYFRRHRVPLGEKGDHLQTLVLAARRDVLERVGGYPPALNYGEAIAAEIALSKRVQAAGFAIAQVGRRSFQCFSHPQWAGRMEPRPAVPLAAIPRATVP